MFGASFTFWIVKMNASDTVSEPSEHVINIFSVPEVDGVKEINPDAAIVNSEELSERVTGLLSISVQFTWYVNKVFSVAVWSVRD